MSKKKQPTITHDEWIRGLLPSVQERPPNSFTLDEAIAATGMKRTSTMNSISEAVRTGKLIKHKVILNGRAGWAYTEAKK